MNSPFERIRAEIEGLKIDCYSEGLTKFIDSEGMSIEQIEALEKVFGFLNQQKQKTIKNTLLKMSRLPLKSPKTFEQFDFGRISGKNVELLRNLQALTSVNAGQNIAFIGPQGVGKTHLAMAYGRECCNQGYKTYFLKATELNQRLMDAVKYGKESKVINSLVKASCLIIDEIGRCIFNIESTRMFFDIVDRRYNKEGPNIMIFTSNITPDKWNDFFSEDSTLLCALDRIFDNARVFVIKGDSFRGKKLETIAIESSNNKFRK